MMESMVHFLNQAQKELKSAMGSMFGGLSTLVEHLMVFSVLGCPKLLLALSMIQMRSCLSWHLPHRMLFKALFR